MLLHPERVAAAWLRSGVPLLRLIPHATGDQGPHPARRGAEGACHVQPGHEGRRDRQGRSFRGRVAGERAFFSEVRSKGGLIGVAVDPLSSHECGNQRYFAIPWLDACLSVRLPKVSGRAAPGNADVTARGWPRPPAREAVPAAMFAGDPLKAAWLPNEAIARAWMQYVKDTAVDDKTPPPAPTNVRLRGNELSWDAEADLESGLASFIIERDGKFLAKLPEKGNNPFGRPVFQNLQYSDTPTQPLVPMRFTDAKASLARNTPTESLPSTPSA